MKALERGRMGGRGQGTLAKFEGSPNWGSCYYVRGVEHRPSTGTPDLKKAKRIHKQNLDEVAADRQGLKPYLTPPAGRGSTSSSTTWRRTPGSGRSGRGRVSCRT